MKGKYGEVGRKRDVEVGRGVRVALGVRVGAGVQVGSMRARGVEVGGTGEGEAVIVGEAAGAGVQAAKIITRQMKSKKPGFIFRLPYGCGSDQRSFVTPGWGWG